MPMCVACVRERWGEREGGRERREKGGKCGIIYTDSDTNEMKVD